MIISDEFRFVFMHIPKCAGTSVRAALNPFDARREKYFLRGVDDHDALGRLDYHHIPLETLRRHFVDDYRCVEDYATFAVVRDPTARFSSSLAQRLLMYKDRRLHEMSADAVKSEIEEVFSGLSALPRQVPVLEPELIHFARQIDYIEIDGCRLIDNIYSLDDVDRLFSTIEEITSHRLKADTPRNFRFRYKYPGLVHLDRVARRSLRAVLPTRLWVPVSSGIKRILIGTGVLEKGWEVHSDIFRSQYVLEFIEEFYRDDLTLYSEISAN